MSSRTQTTKYEDDDEYSFDDLDGIDLDSIPELRATPLAVTSTPSQSRQFTGEPYDCSSLQYLVPSSLPHVTELDTHNESLLSAPNKTDDTTAAPPKSPVLARSTTSLSTEYDFEDDVDDEFLRELDALESELVSVTNQPSRPSALPNAGNPTNLTATTSQLIPQTKPLLQHHAPVLLDRKCSVSTACDEYRVAGRNSSQKRSLQDESENEYNHSDDTSVVATIAPIRATTHEDGRSQKKLKKFMEDFEDEISCPICYDIFACAYLFNPCGHSFCGDCALGWVEKNIGAPICAVCRTLVNKQGAMIANIALDNTVQRHVDAMGENGDVEWQRSGFKLLEWTKRKEEWKTKGVKRMFDVLKPRKSRRK